MKRAVRGGAAAVVAMALAIVCSSPAAADFTGDELQCQLATSLTVGKFLSQKMKCIMTCQHNAYVNEQTPSDCVPPYANATFGCVNSQENNGSGHIQSNCNKDCPECYTNGDCATDADDRISAAETQVDTLAADVFCDDSGSTDGLTLSEEKCRLTTAKFLSQFAAKKIKCYARCRKSEIGGKVTPGDCTPPAADLKTQECISRLEDKVAFLIDKKCESSINPSADKPECGSYPTSDGAARVVAQEAIVDGMHAGLFCNDP